MCRTSGLLRWSLLLWMLKDDAALAYKCSEVSDMVFDRASECVLKVMHPVMLEAFGKSQPSAITASGTPDLQQVKQAWNKSCTTQANSIDEDKARLTFMVETCLNSTIFTTQFEASAAAK
ncbi:uncharacterized protein LOC119446213 isoform X7 [Dermacentor silvarum]|uniref:uncharacterized protein LOC119446213 isoform X6 n=1 Tax=Dermacentor silvarum TaxID=543639 RepID=UPI002100764D|nr:uncharacterized protein LOC119446213 isoform X6 [Dermacentor silvarum]XP_049519963.1 uncharacterized protein LOC119446213 isoform X7 [Dermacentor silvarum]